MVTQSSRRRPCVPIGTWPHEVIEKAHAGLMRIEAGHQRRPRRTAAGRVVELREPHAMLRQGIDVRRGNFAAIAAEVRPTHVVDENDDDIGWRFCLGGQTGRKVVKKRKRSGEDQ